MNKVVDPVVDNKEAVDNLKKAVAARLKQVRSALKMTQIELCEVSGMPLPSLKNYEGAKQIPGGTAQANLSKAGINTSWLMTGEGPMLLTALPDAEAQYQTMQAGDGRMMMAMEQAPAPFDARRDLLEAVLRVGEYKILHNQVTKHVVEFGLEGAPSWLEAAQEFPDLELRLRNMIATFKFINAAGVP